LESDWRAIIDCRRHRRHVAVHRRFDEAHSGVVAHHVSAPPENEDF
jgi:hypothetical protein